MNFQERSYEEEILDQPGVPFADIRRNMVELDVINSWLGGHRISVHGFNKIFRASVDAIPKNRVWTIWEIGCGGGDNLRVLKDHCRRLGIEAKLTGIDINPRCIEYAQSRAANDGIDFICSDYASIPVIRPPDIIFSSLFCHHFSNSSLVEQIRWMEANSQCGFFINDLHRHRFAYHSIKILTRLFSGSYLVRHDAPLSVRRAFRRQEWIDLLHRSGITSFDIRWKWAFRWLVTAIHVN